MARTTTAKQELSQLIERLSDEDRKRLLDVAERLAEASESSDAAAKSLADEGKVPIYMAAADTQEYKIEKRRRANQTWG